MIKVTKKIPRAIFCLGLIFSPFHLLAKIEEVIPLSVGLEHDHPLKEEFKGKNLNFHGTFIRFTEHSYNPKTNIIRFRPTKKGVGTLHIKEGKTILKKYTIDIRETDLNRVAHEIQSLLKEIDGITIKIVNRRVVVDGEIVTPRDMKRIINVLKEYPKQASSLVTLSASAQNEVALFIEKEIANPNITVKAANGKFILRGEVSSDKEKDEAFVIAQLYAPSVITEAAVKSGAVREWNPKEIIINLIKVRKPPSPKKKQNKLVQMVVHYVELDKNYTDRFKFEWTPSIGDDTQFSYRTAGGLSDAVGVIQGTINNFLPKLNWAKQFGFARVLHTFNLVVENGEKGEVSSSKSIYVSGSPSDGEKPEQAHAKVGGTLTPTIVGSRQDGVRLNIHLQVNSFLGKTPTGPTIGSREIKTILYIRSGLSAAIGGIVSSNKNKGVNRTPDALVNRDPLISLLSSKNVVYDQNQFVFFVTPIIKSSASIGVEKIKKKFRVGASN